MEVSSIVVVPSSSCRTSPRKVKSLGDAKALLLENDTLVLQNHFSSFDGFETTDAGGDPHTGTPIILTAIVKLNFEHITVENQVISKFWADPNDMEEHASDIGQEIVCTKKKQGDHLRGLVNPKKLLSQFSLKRHNEGLFIFLEC